MDVSHYILIIILTINDLDWYCSLFLHKNPRSKCGKFLHNKPKKYAFYDESHWNGECERVKIYGERIEK